MAFCPILNLQEFLALFLYFVLDFLEFHHLFLVHAGNRKGPVRVALPLPRTKVPLFLVSFEALGGLHFE